MTTKIKGAIEVWKYSKEGRRSIFVDRVTHIADAFLYCSSWSAPEKLIAISHPDLEAYVQERERKAAKESFNMILRQIKGIVFGYPTDCGRSADMALLDIANLLEKKYKDFKKEQGE